MRRLAAATIVLAFCALAAAPAPAATVKRVAPRAYAVTLAAPPQADLAIARLSFKLGARAHGRHPAVRLAFGPPSPGTLYGVAARVTKAGRGNLAVLVATVNRRPAGALYPDLSRVNVRVYGARLTHRPVVDEVGAAFAQRKSASAVSPAICRRDLRTLAAPDVSTLLQAGTAFGFDAATVASEGFDAACSHPVDPAFERAVTQYGTCPPCDPQAGQPCPLSSQSAAYPCRL